MASHGRSIGRIKQLQVQRASLSVFIDGVDTYDPSPLMRVERLALTPSGVIGLQADGTESMDVHNTSHPASRNRGGENGVSLNFTGHYDLLRREFGSHVRDGIAGENVLIEVNHVFALPELGKHLVIRSATSSQMVALHNVIVAAPCTKFSQYVTNQPMLRGPALKATLQFLNQGRRGFYATLDPAQNYAVLQLGDEVFVM